MALYPSNPIDGSEDDGIDPDLATSSGGYDGPSAFRPAGPGDRVNP